ncbi:type IIL restriction-modification enzyme MmeI [Streptomyces sp. NBC_01217]|uniref:type IIL restriction-modification enzyme MmeI n=1 Tax=Streptomyces sp. NBC_01217 TaxID=2903779 RepID=UPI002E15BD5A|nr:hypothetical protein OG507_30665 [Streptomyces sp. NBC_01217]
MPRIVAETDEDIEVERISALLEPGGRVDGNPKRLAENLGLAFMGCIVLGMGFVLEPDEAAAWIESDPKYKDVLFPYLNGEDLNSRPDGSASRWVIDFYNWPERQAETYELPYLRALERVKPERSKNKRKPRRERWWQFAELAHAMREATSDLDEVLAIALVSKSLMPLRIPARQVFSNTLGIFAANSYADQAVLSSSLHQMWAIKYGSGLRNDPRYTPGDVFESFPRPSRADELEIICRVLDSERRELMLRRSLGLTKLYNLVNDPGITDSADGDVARIREIHVQLDRAVMAAYGWDDVALDHGFHTYRQMERWTVSPTARVEILDRLLEENHRRAASQGVVSPSDNNEATEEEEGDE